MESKKTLAVVGSREFRDYAALERALDERKGTFGTIVSGGARGADALAERYARARKLNLVVLRPDWDKHGRGAGLRRNTDIVARADSVVAFWDGKSPGTRDTIEKAEKAGKPVTVVRFSLLQPLKEKTMSI
jgi:predicted Rossmann fold nucleotide-binding protein DprA/Smf involved in DNA uptake